MTKTEPTQIQVWTEFGIVTFNGDTPEATHKALKSTLRKIHLSIQKLRFLREVSFNGVLNIEYQYAPTAFRYNRSLAAALAEENIEKRRTR